MGNRGVGEVPHKKPTFFRGQVVKYRTARGGSWRVGEFVSDGGTYSIVRVRPVASHPSSNLVVLSSGMYRIAPADSDGEDIECKESMTLETFIPTMK